MDSFKKAKYIQWLNHLQYLIIFTVCTVILGFEISVLADKYFDKNTGTADKYVHISKTSFPDLTFCPTNPYKEELLNKNGITRKEYQWDAKWNSNDTNVSPKQLFDTVVYKVDEIVHKVKVFMEKAVAGSNMIVFNTTDILCNQRTAFEAEPYYYNGNCYRFAMPRCFLEAGPLEIAASFRVMTDIFVHHEGQFQDPNSRARVNVAKGQFQKVSVIHEVVKQLGDGISNCTNEFGTRSTHDDCIFEKLHKLMMTEVGCTVPFLQNKSNICKDPWKSKLAFQIYQDNRRNNHNICPRNCLSTNVYLGAPVTGEYVESEVAWLVLYFRRDIKVISEYLLDTFMSLVAEFGGYTGLLLGLSLVHLADYISKLIYYISN